MTKTYLTGVLAAATLIGAAQTVVAQDEGKTAAAELASESQAALQQLCAQRTSGEGARAEGVCHPVFPEVTKAGLGIGGHMARAPC